LTELKNGLKVVSEYIPHFRSISLGFWIRAGSRNETSLNSGITHLIEHLLFKGTLKRTYKDIAIAFDSMGAEFNAFTDKENCCLYSDFIDLHLDKCLGLLFDVTCSPSFLPENISLEKKVIYEEIKMLKDNPTETIFNSFFELVFDGHPLSMPILGKKKALSGLKRNHIIDYYKSSFTPPNIVIAAAGNVKHKELVEKVKKNVDKYDFSGRKNIVSNIPAIPKKARNRNIKSKNLAFHIVYGGIGCNRSSKDRYPLSLFTNILGGSMSSRLFQKIREDLGLSYSIFAANSQYTDAGIIGIHAASSYKNHKKIFELIKKELEDVKKNGVKPSELDISKENMKGNIVLSVEDISSRMVRLGKSVMMDGNIVTINDILRKIDDVRTGDIDDIVYKYYQTDKMSLVTLGAKG